MSKLEAATGLAKRIYPYGIANAEEVLELLEPALEGRQQVKEQPKKVGSFEHHQTSFSSVSNET